MKKLLSIFIITTFILFSCKKEVPKPVKIVVYKTDIKGANHNEPPYIYWYLRQVPEGYLIVTHTIAIYNFEDVVWFPSPTFPKDLEGLKPLGITYLYLK